MSVKTDDFVVHNVDFDKSANMGTKHKVIVTMLLIRFAANIVLWVTSGFDGRGTYKPECPHSIFDIAYIDLILTIMVSLIVYNADLDKLSVGWWLVLAAYCVAQVVFFGICVDALTRKRKYDCYIHSAIAELVAIASPLTALVLVQLCMKLLEFCDSVFGKVKTLHNNPTLSV